MRQFHTNYIFTFILLYTNNFRLCYFKTCDTFIKDFCLRGRTRVWWVISLDVASLTISYLLATAWLAKYGKVWQSTSGNGVPVCPLLICLCQWGWWLPLNKTVQAVYIWGCTNFHVYQYNMLFLTRIYYTGWKNLVHRQLFFQVEILWVKIRIKLRYAWI